MALFSAKFVIFIAVLLVAYYTIPKKFQWIVLLCASIVFYYLNGGLRAGVFITVTILTTFFGARKIGRIDAEGKEALKNPHHKLGPTEKKAIKAETAKRKKKYFLITLIFNFGILAVLKYGGFTVLNINRILDAVHADTQIAMPSFILPLGISFYTFQVMGYLIDVYRGKYEPDGNLFQFALFASYFPQIIQGPIGRHDALAPQLYGQHNYNAEYVRRGFLRLLWGFFKKKVVADRLTVLVTEVTTNYTTEGYSGLTIFLSVLIYGIQIYADFSGGIDIIIGVSDMLGITMDENFRQPFMSKSVSEFWQRWHISLGHWMKDYVFYPIALSKPFNRMQKKMKKRIGNHYAKIIPSVFASFLVFLIVGLWHGANWKYVVYGIYQGALVSSHTLFERPYAKMRKACHIDGESFSWKLFQMARTTILITFGRYFDVAGGTRHAFSLFKATFSTWNPGILFDGTMTSLGVDSRMAYFLIWWILIMVVVDIFNENGIRFRDVIAKQGIVFRYIVYFAAVIVIMRFGVYGPGYNATEFIYQGF